MAQQTAVEKAKELIESFAETIEPVIIGVLVERNWNNAKQCALIAVDEILMEFMFDDSEYATRRYNYWQEVKQEIEKL